MKYQQNDFADLVRQIFTHFGFEPNREILATLVMTYVTMHPKARWTLEDVTDDVRAEAPHVRIPDEVRFHMRHLFLSAEVIQDVEAGLSALGINLDDMGVVSQKLIQKMEESEDGYIAVSAMVSTPVGMAAFGGKHEGWEPTESEMAVLSNAIDEASRKHLAFGDGEGVISRDPMRGGMEFRPFLTNSAIDSVVSEAQGALEDDKLTSAIDAWADQFKEGR